MTSEGGPVWLGGAGGRRTWEALTGAAPQHYATVHPDDAALAAEERVRDQQDRERLNAHILAGMRTAGWTGIRDPTTGETRYDFPSQGLRQWREDRHGHRQYINPAPPTPKDDSHG